MQKERLGADLARQAEQDQRTREIYQRQKDEWAIEDQPVNFGENIGATSKDPRNILNDFDLLTKRIPSVFGGDFDKETGHVLVNGKPVTRRHLRLMSEEVDAAVTINVDWKTRLEGLKYEGTITPEQQQELDKINADLPGYYSSYIDRINAAEQRLKGRGIKASGFDRAKKSAEAKYKAAIDAVMTPQESAKYNLEMGKLSLQYDKARLDLYKAVNDPNMSDREKAVLGSKLTVLEDKAKKLNTILTSDVNENGEAIPIEQKSKAMHGLIRVIRDMNILQQRPGGGALGLTGGKQPKDTVIDVQPIKAESRRTGLVMPKGYTGTQERPRTVRPEYAIKQIVAQAPQKSKEWLNEVKLSFAAEHPDKIAELNAALQGMQSLPYEAQSGLYAQPSPAAQEIGRRLKQSYSPIPTMR